MTKKITTAAGRPHSEQENSLSAGSRGPLLLQDYVLHENLAHFNRERIPERIVHAKGSAAYGKFVLTHDISAYTKADIFKGIGKETKIFLRFSTVGGEKGSADTERDPRGFAIKFYTKEGNWDLVGNNTPVFFIKDPKKFPDFIHTQKRDPRSNCKSATMMWDYWSLNPESLHQVMILMSDRGTPYSYRYMNGYGSHTFSFINEKNELFWVKFHFKTAQGIKNLSAAEAEKIKGQDPDWAQRDLIHAIDAKDFPIWHLKIQIMSQEQAKETTFNPFDLTKVWPQADFPLIDVGYLELNEIPDNYFAHVEQAAFAPTQIVNGIGFSPDKMLQGRILSYPDAQRYRLGTNYQHIPVNACPYASHHYQRDGAMTTTNNGGSTPNYFPNSFDKAIADPKYKEIPVTLDATLADWHDRNAEGENDHYSQAAVLFDKVMNNEEKKNTIANIVAAMKGIEGEKKEQIIQRQLCHFFRASVGLGMAVAQGLGLSMDALSNHTNTSKNI
jgi:catalase